MPPPPKSVLGGWTIQRATVTGIAFGIAALLLSAVMKESLLWPYAALLVLTMICGLSILLITIQDVRTQGRGTRMRPIRAFDIAMSLALSLPAAYGLWQIWPLLGL